MLSVTKQGCLHVQRLLIAAHSPVSLPGCLLAEPGQDGIREANSDRKTEPGAGGQDIGRTCPYMAC